ncbi:MAG: hypothetical protein ABFS32_23295 [Bacteroidota bacterium]
MVLLKRSIYFLSLVLITCCNSESSPIGQEVLRSDFSEAEFENAIIGIWNSVYIKEGEANVVFLCITEEKTATLTIEESMVTDTHEGNVTIEFLRPTSPGVITLAKLIITTHNGEIVLSRVNIGLHNALPDDGSLYLRIEESPYGVLEKD